MYFSLKFSTEIRFEASDMDIKDDGNVILPMTPKQLYL